MKRKAVTWADEGDFGRIKDAIKGRDIATATIILQSLSPELLASVLHQEDGYVIIRVVKLAYMKRTRGSYKKSEFDDIYELFINSDAEYAKNCIIEAGRQIIAASPFKILPALFEISKHM